MATALVEKTASTFPQPKNGSRVGEPAWDVALLYPPQGSWSEAEYLELGTYWPIEFVDGVVEFLPMPTLLHQLIVDYLHERFKAFIKENDSGVVLQGPLRVRVGKRVIRLPDVVFFRPDHIPADLRKMPNGADLAMEIVSEGRTNRERDYTTKRREYARARIAEYWIVDPQERRITVLTLDGNAYRVHGEFIPGQKATSVMFPAFGVDVNAVFPAGEGQTHPKKKSRGRSRSQSKRRPGGQPR
jgi:Uma2 family endonuclease